ncbi:MAG TPA: hypothetical protein VFY48_00080 [Solirubrobacterales bacterium]|nr:hypothetical protein [Solirubrobacterales bacterium]
MIKRITVLAMAAGVVAAFALPTSASASWKHHNTPVVTDVQIGITGNARFQGGLGGIECQVTARIKNFTGQTTGIIETFAPHPTSDTANCKGLGGLAFCQMHNVTPQAPNWVGHTASATTVTVTTTEIAGDATGGFCPIKRIVLTGTTATITPNQPNTVSSGTFSGTLEADLTTNSGAVDKETVQFSGSGVIESPNANTYSI